MGLEKVHGSGLRSPPHMGGVLALGLVVEHPHSKGEEGGSGGV